MGNVRADVLFKDAANRETIDAQFTYSAVQMRNINNKKLKDLWMCRWMVSTKGTCTRLIYPEINMTRLSADFYYNQILTGPGIFGAFRNRIYGKDYECQCGEDETIKHVLMECPIWAQQRGEIPKSWSVKEIHELVHLPRFKTYAINIVKSLTDSRSANWTD
ncbi:hypothetical protein AVEN_260960-1 [Araneus ventricosus]|uniref:Reverse transcriptase zinc-binding domain-containing protein n=1 Tax=Araneus ventricosus TaxID=182803 RepID=A0A4Y2PVU0_ARAVE|nr:hypothetical protein AVEN_260960-1 [Araneus ventricosus]